MDVHGGKDAAVLVPVFEDAGGALHAVFTRRRHDLRRHAGEISFPGGRQDEGETLLETALREAHEEVGLPPADVRVLGALPPTPTFVTNYAIYPFVGPDRARLRLGRPAHRGRRGARAPPRATLQDGYGERRLIRRGIAFRTPTYETGGHLIWGATARILGRRCSSASALR